MSVKQNLDRDVGLTSAPYFEMLDLKSFFASFIARFCSAWRRIIQLSLTIVRDEVDELMEVSAEKVLSSSSL